MTADGRSPAATDHMGSGRAQRTVRRGRPSAVAKALSKYRAILTTQLGHNLAYPADVASRGLAIVLFMWVFVHLWRAAYGATGREAINGLTLYHTLWYLMLAEAIMLSKPRLAPVIAQAVRDGTIALLLNRPYNFLLYQLSVGLGDSVLRFGFNVVAGAALVWPIIGPPPAPIYWPLVLVAVAAGWLIDFCITALIGLAAFAAEDVSAFEWVYSKILFIMGGLLLPLDFLPSGLQRAAMALPFAYAIYGPARLFVTPSLDRAVHVFAAQLGWLVVLSVVLSLVYRRGTSWLAINGG